MEWNPVELKAEETKPRIRGRMATHELARKEIAEEIAKAQGGKRQGLRLEALERAAEAWQRRKDAEEFRKREEGQEKTGSQMEAVPIKETRAEAKIEGQPQDLEVAGWLQQGLAQWAEKNQPEITKEGRRPNSATMAVILRRAVAREKALALGRELPDPRVIALEQEAARWEERKEEERRVIQREIGMLQKLVQLMVRDELFDENKAEEEWGIGQVSCFADKVSRDGWNLIVVALGKSQFMLRWGWGDLLGVYQAELDDQLNLKNYVRITSEEVEEYLRERGKDGSNWN